MKLLRELMEQFRGGPDIKLGPFTLKQHDDYEDDNIKTWHFVYKDGKEIATLDHSPYEQIDEDTFARYLAFYNKHGRFPSREDIDSNGPLNNDDVARLVQ